jgi:hypothetical protein
MKKILLFIFAFIAVNLHSQNKIESSTEESFSNGTWQLSWGSNYQYDASNNLTSTTSYSRNAGVWTASYRTIYTYNASNRATTRTEQNWNITTNQFDNANRASYTYDSFGKIITILDQDWIANAWVNTNKSDFTYNGNLIASVANPKWVGSQWVNDYRTTTTYTGIYLTQFVDEKWNGTLWVNDYRGVLTYNTSNKITNNRYDNWSGTAWTEGGNSNYVLAANGNRTSNIYSYLGVIGEKVDFTYDAAALMSSFVHPFKDKTGLDYITEDFPYVNKILNSLAYSYNVSTAAYVLSNRTTYNYLNQLVLNTKSVEIKTIKLYPNPTTSILNIDMDSQINDVRIVDILGKTIDVKNFANKEINVSSLANGVYFIEVKTTDGFFREKFIKN